MLRVQLLPYIAALSLACGCDPTPPESMLTPTPASGVEKIATSAERLTIIGYQLAPGVDDDAVNQLLADGLNEEEIARRGLITNVRSVVPERKWSNEPRGEWAIDDENIADGQTLSIVIFQTERVNVYHNPPRSTCRAIEVSAGAWWLPLGSSPQVRAEWFWRVGTTPWNQWATNELVNIPFPFPVWAGSDSPSFRYQFINHAVVFSVPGVDEPGRRDVTIRAVSQSPSFCGQTGGGSW